MSQSPATPERYLQPVKCVQTPCPESGCATYSIGKDGAPDHLEAPPKGWASKVLEPSKRVAFACPEHRGVFA